MNKENYMVITQKIVTIQIYGKLIYLIIMKMIVFQCLDGLNLVSIVLK